MNKVTLSIGFMSVFALFACTEENPPGPGLPNPVSVFCEENGGKIEIREDKQGNQQGICVFPNGNECDEWAYYRGECSPDSQQVPEDGQTGPQDAGIIGMPNPASVNCKEKGGSLKIVDGPDGQTGICTFPGGATCEEWALFRGECSPDNDQADQQDSGIGMANPASTNCIKQGGSLKIIDTADGQIGECTFPGGAKCEEWALYRDECSADKPNFCLTASDCSCGVHIVSRECFRGQKEFVDASTQCPDFCTGIAGNFITTCAKNQCTHTIN